MSMSDQEAQIVNAERTLQKAKEVIRWAGKFFEGQANMNAASHLSQNVMFPPIYSALESTMRGIDLYFKTFPANDELEDGSGKESNLVEHARRELAILNNGELFDEQILRMLRIFGEMGHSGGSAGYTIPMIGALLSFENLSQLTNDPAEWNLVEMGDHDCWQSSRRSDAFTYDPEFRKYYVLGDHGALSAADFKAYESEDRDDEMFDLFNTIEKTAQENKS